MTRFDLNDTAQTKTFDRFDIDERLNPDDLIFVIYLVMDKLVKISLTENAPSASYLDFSFGVVNYKLYINGHEIAIGLHELDGMPFLVLSKFNTKTHYFTFDRTRDLVIGSGVFSGIKTINDNQIVLHQDQLIVTAEDAFIFHDATLVQGHQIFPILDGTTLLTSHCFNSMVSEFNFRFELVYFSYLLNIDDFCRFICLQSETKIFKCYSLYNCYIPFLSTYDYILYRLYKRIR